MLNKVFRKNLHTNFLIIFSFIIMSFISIIVMLHNNALFSGADLLFHIKRILELDSDFSHGNIFPKYSFNQFHGSAVMILYPYINLLPISLLSFFIRSKILIIYLWMSLNIFFSLCNSFFGSIRISKSIATSYVFAIIYSLSTVYLSYMFYDSDFGVITVIAFLPLVVFGFINWIKNDSWIELSVGIIAVIFSHILSVFIVIGFLTLWLIINYKYITKKQIKSLIKMVIIISLVTSIVWIRLVKFLLYNYRNISSLGFPKLQGTKFTSLLKMDFGNGITYDLSLLALLSVAMGLLFYKKFNNIIKQMYIISLIVIFICSKFFPWNIIQRTPLKVIRIFQFSWRFYIIPQILLCYVLSYIVTKCIKHKSIKRITITLCILVTIGLQVFNQFKIVDVSANDPIITHCTNFNKMELFKIKHFNGFTRPSYRITNNSQFMYATRLDGNGIKKFHDYYPKNSVSDSVYINNNIMPNNKSYDLKYVGYNEYLFNNKYNLHNIVIPIFKYNEERIRIYLNGKLDHYIVNKHNLIVLKHVPYGINKIRLE